MIPVAPSKVPYSLAIASNPKLRPRAKASLRPKITSIMTNKRRRKKTIIGTDIITGRNKKNRVALGAIGRVRLCLFYKVVVPRATSLLTYLKRLPLTTRKIRLFPIYPLMQLGLS